MRIGILGGTFDPPHLWHLEIARAAVEQLELDELIFIPAHQNPLKGRAQVTPKKRMRMVQLMIANDPKLSLSDIELTRMGPSYTVETLMELQLIKPGEYWFIAGSDICEHMADWKQPDRLAKLTNLAVFLRPPHDQSDVLRWLPEPLGRKVKFLDIKPSSLSSTSIRMQLERGYDESEHLHPDVVRYIKEQGLYQDSYPEIS